jgi:hypothetical protein
LEKLNQEERQPSEILQIDQVEMNPQPYHQSQSSVISVRSDDVIEAVNQPFDSSPVFPPKENSSAIDLPADFPSGGYIQSTIQPT